jgi:hypothetical protein
MRVAIYDRIDPKVPGEFTLRLTQNGCQRGATAPAGFDAVLGAHRSHAALPGARHALILAHPERDKSVLLSVAPRTSQSETDRVATLLGHKEIPPSDLYRFKDLWPRMTTAPLPDVAHA